MVDVDTFLSTLYVITDDFCQRLTHPRGGLAPRPPCVIGELITLAIFARWSRFASERDFYRFACSNLREGFYADDIERHRENGLASGADDGG